ncbi:hypothetical protein B0H19DRAFT_1276541 [Mycena capillaripes]|nr:hypothetical protein B0H19DRAFT_1276541 [Mycena capillaripes]
MRFSLVIIAAPFLLSCLAFDASSFESDHCGLDASGVDIDNATIAGQYSICLDLCGTPLRAAIQTALAANSPVYNKAINDCADAVQALRTTLVDIPPSDRLDDNYPYPGAWEDGLPNTESFPPFKVPAATPSGSVSTSGLDDGGGSSKPTGPASPTQSGHKNGVKVLSTSFWLITLTAAGMVSMT